MGSPGGVRCAWDLIMAWDIISRAAAPDVSLGAGSESKITWAQGLIHIWGKMGKVGKYERKNGGRGGEIGGGRKLGRGEKIGGWKTGIWGREKWEFGGGELDFEGKKGMGVPKPTLKSGNTGITSRGVTRGLL